MHKVFITIALIAIAIWTAMWIGSRLLRHAITRSPEHVWPLRLGTLSDVPARYPATPMSSGTARLITLARPLGIDLGPRNRSEGVSAPGGPMAFVRSQLGAWVMEELLKPLPAIEPMPSEAGEYLTAHAGDLAIVRALLLSPEPMVWPSDVTDRMVPLPNLIGLMELHRLLAASALDRTRAGDPRAWDDLRAAWRLSMSLVTQPDGSSVLVALAIARSVNAAARKLPLPSPAWLGEIEAFDFRRVLIAAYQVGAWSIVDQVHAETTFDTPDGSFADFTRRKADVIVAPYTRMSAADIAEQWRRTAIEIANTAACDLDPVVMTQRQAESIAWWNAPARAISVPNLNGMWQRVLRFDAEREATIRALDLRAGKPPRPRSRCSDGSWIYSADGRGFTFSRKMKDLPVPANAIPLEFSLDARQ